MAPEYDEDYPGDDGGDLAGRRNLKVLLVSALRDWFFCPASLWIRLHDQSNYPFTRTTRTGETYTDERQVVVELEPDAVDSLTSSLAKFVEKLTDDGYEGAPAPVLSQEWGAISHFSELVLGGPGWLTVKRLTKPRTHINRHTRLGLATQLKALEEQGLEPAGAVVLCPHPDNPDKVKEHFLPWTDEWRETTAEEIQRLWKVINGHQPETGYWNRCDSCQISSCYALDYYLAHRPPISPEPLEISL